MFVRILLLFALLVFAFGIVRGARTSPDNGSAVRTNLLSDRAILRMRGIMGLVLLIGVLIQRYHG